MAQLGGLAAERHGTTSWACEALSCCWGWRGEQGEGKGASTAEVGQGRAAAPVRWFPKGQRPSCHWRRKSEGSPLMAVLREWARGIGSGAASSMRLWLALGDLVLRFPACRRNTVKRCLWTKWVFWHDNNCCSIATTISVEHSFFYLQLFICNKSWNIWQTKITLLCIWPLFRGCVLKGTRCTWVFLLLSCVPLENCLSAARPAGRAAGTCVLLCVCRKSAASWSVGTVCMSVVCMYVFLCRDRNMAAWGKTTTFFLFPNPI